jgi:anti-anti-sigma factor
MPHDTTRQGPTPRHGRSTFGSFRLRGDLDMATAREARVQLWAYAATSEGDVVCDCTELDFLDSSGLAMLIAVRDELAECGRRLRLTNLSPVAHRAVRLYGLGELVTTVAPASPPALSAEATALLRHMAEMHPYTTLRDAATETGFSADATASVMQELCEAGCVQRLPERPPRASLFGITAAGRRIACRRGAPGRLGV